MMGGETHSPTARDGAGGSVTPRNVRNGERTLRKCICVLFIKGRIFWAATGRDLLTMVSIIKMSEIQLEGENLLFAHFNRGSYDDIMGDCEDVTSKWRCTTNLITELGKWYIENT